MQLSRKEQSLTATQIILRVLDRAYGTYAAISKHSSNSASYNMTAKASSTTSSGGDGTPSSSSSAAETAQEIKSLLSQLRKSRKKKKNKKSSSNKSVSVRTDREDAQRLDKLRRIFSLLIDQQEFDLNTNNTNNTNCNNNNNNNSAGESIQWKKWLSTQHTTFISYLLDDIIANNHNNNNNNSISSLRTYCGVLASSPVAITGLSDDGDDNNSDSDGDGMISERLLNKLLESVFKSRLAITTATSASSQDHDDDDEDCLTITTTDESVLQLLQNEFISPYYDVQYFVYKGIHSIVLELLASLERMSSSSNNNNNDDDGATTVRIVAKVERNVGIVAENICRVLLMMENVVPTKSNAVELADGTAGYLFRPPILGGRGGVVEDDEYDDEYDEDDDSEASASSNDSSDDDDDDDDDDEDDTTSNNKRKKKQHSNNNNNNNNKRLKKKKTRLIAWQQPYKHRFAHQEAWLSVLRLPNLPVRVQKRVLQHLSTYVLKICPSPLRFAEYFTRSFQRGVGVGVGRSTITTTDGTTTTNSYSNSSANSLTAILSLHGLFILMLDHQLEYPQFYNSLYQLLHPRILYTKHRTRFLRLLSKSLLSNSMLPAYVVASFCKKLCRLALSAPPSGGLFVLALVSNLLRKHGECACLIHRSSKGKKNEEDDTGMGSLIEDVFVEDVNDMIKTRALESSLWELVALEKHYHPAISTLAKSVGTEDDKTTPMHDMEDFMAHTYKSLFEQEKKRLGGGGGGSSSGTGGGGNKKRGGGTKVSLTFVKPEGLFTKDDVFAGMFKQS